MPEITLLVNGVRHALTIDTRLSLLDLLRENSYHATGQRVRDPPIRPDRLLPSR